MQVASCPEAAQRNVGFAQLSVLVNWKTHFTLPPFCRVGNSVVAQVLPSLTHFPRTTKTSPLAWFAYVPEANLQADLAAGDDPKAGMLTLWLARRCSSVEPPWEAAKLMARVLTPSASDAQAPRRPVQNQLVFGVEPTAEVISLAFEGGVASAADRVDKSDSGIDRSMFSVTSRPVGDPLTKAKIRAKTQSRN